MPHATGGGPFKEGWRTSPFREWTSSIPVVIVYIPGCPPTPQALLNGLIMLQKKIDGERLEIPVLGKHGFSPWYGNEVERDIPIPVLGPDLIDLVNPPRSRPRTTLAWDYSTSTKPA